VQNSPLTLRQNSASPCLRAWEPPPLIPRFPPSRAA
jgi:hypothetical protein